MVEVIIWSDVSFARRIDATTARIFEFRTSDLAISETLYLADLADLADLRNPKSGVTEKPEPNREKEFI